MYYGSRESVNKDAGPPGRAVFVFIYLEGILLEGRRLAK